MVNDIESQMFAKVIACYWKLCLFKASPENTPYSLMLMIFAGFLYGLIMILQWQIVTLASPITLSLSIMAVITLYLSYLLYTWILLKTHSLEARFVQTLTALWMTHFIIHLFAFPTVALTPFLLQANVSNPFLLFIAVCYLFATLGLSIWQVLITAHIYRCALSLSDIQAFLASVGLVALNFLTVSLWR